MNCMEKVNYADLSFSNLIKKFKPMLDSGAMYITPGGKFKFKSSDIVSHDPPWVHVRTTTNRQCGLWHHVYFNALRFIPTPCMECWKIVVRPQTLEQLFQLYFIQKRLDYPSKCGLEVRPYVFGNYGGYFYTDSLQEGLERWNEVKDTVHAEIGPEIKVILKRGCTEFERTFPHSSTWAAFNGQAQLETRLNNLFVRERNGCPQPDIVKEHVMSKWIEYAHTIGDETYLKYTDGMEIFSVPYETFHTEEEKSNEPPNCDSNCE